MLANIFGSITMILLFSKEFLLCYFSIFQYKINMFRGEEKTLRNSKIEQILIEKQKGKKSKHQD